MQGDICSETSGAWRAKQIYYPSIHPSIHQFSIDASLGGFARSTSQLSLGQRQPPQDIYRQFGDPSSPHVCVFWTVGGSRSTRSEPTRTCKLSRRVEPVTCLLWGDNANCCTTVSPTLSTRTQNLSAWLVVCEHRAKHAFSDLKIGKRDLLNCKIYLQSLNFVCDFVIFLSYLGKINHLSLKTGIKVCVSVKYNTVIIIIRRIIISNNNSSEKKQRSCCENWC